MPFQIKKAACADKNFTLFFLSQLLLNFGSYIQMIAVAILLMRTTGSGLVTGFGMVCSSLPSILFSLFAGGMAEHLSSKKSLILIDLFRCILTLLFILCKSAPAVIALLLAINSMEAFYSPSKNKLLLSIAGRENLLNANALLNGGYGAVSMISPALIGLIISQSGVSFAFLLNSFSFFLSVVLISGIRTGRTKNTDLEIQKNPGLSGISEGLSYCLGVRQLRAAVLTTAVLDMSVISVNIAFYSLAFDTLKVGSTYWGLMLSIVYGMNLFAMLILIYFKKRFDKSPLLIVYFLFFIVCAVWLLYSVSSNLLSILAAEAIEGLCLSICNTLLATALLRTSRKEYSARVMSIRDFFSSAAKLIGVAFTCVFLVYFDPRRIFTFYSVLIFFFAVFRFFCVFLSKTRKTKCLR